MAPDLGLDLARRINGERLVVLGWPRAILLQVAHPLVGAGVYQHSSFRASPRASIARLHSTVRAMLAIAFGAQDRRAAAVAGIRAIHRRVNGTLPRDIGAFRAGTPYSAEDPTLLLWVHTTLIESTVIAYEQLVQPLSAPDRDAYCAVSASLPIELGARDLDVPRTWDALTAANEQTVAAGTLAIGPEARALAAALLDEGPSRLMPPVRWLNRTLTVGLLPGAVRELYDMPWTVERAQTLARLTNAIRATRRRTPAFVARFADARQTG